MPQKIKQYFTSFSKSAGHFPPGTTLFFPAVKKYRAFFICPAGAEFRIREVENIPKPTSVNLIMHRPETGRGQESLARMTAELHADAIVRQLKSLTCPDEQKLALLNAVIETARRSDGEQP